MMIRTTHARTVFGWKGMLTGAVVLTALVVVCGLKPGPPSPGEAQKSSLSAFAHEDRPAALETTAPKPDAPEEEASLRSLFRSVWHERRTRFARQTETFLRFTGDPSDSVADENARNDWIGQLTPRQTSAALAYLGTAGIEEAFGADMEARLVRHLAESEMPSAVSQVGALELGVTRELALENVAIVQANVGLDAAVNWVDQMPEGTDRDVAAFAVASEAVRTEPTAALRLAVDLPASDANDELIRRAVVEWAVTDQAAATAWAQQLPDESLRTQVLGAVATVWADRDPGAAAEFAMNELPVGRVQNDVLVGVAQRWAQLSPSEAAAWVEALPAGQLRAAAADSVAAIWAQSAANAAHHWRNVIGDNCL